MCQSRERLLGRVRMDRAETTEMARVQCLEKIECLGAAHFTHEDAIRTMTKGGPEEIRDRNRREGRLVSKRRLRTPRFQPDDVRLLQMDLGCFLDHDDSVLGGDV